MSDFAIIQPTPGNLAMLWGKFRERAELFPDGILSDTSEFVALMASPDTVLYSIGDLAGVAFFSDIISDKEAGEMFEPRASAHVYIWDSAYFGRPDIGNAIARNVMHGWGLRRLFAEIPSSNNRAIRYAKAVGFQQVGVLRERTRMGGQLVEATVLDALKADIEASSGRYRRDRTEERSETVLQDA